MGVLRDLRGPIVGIAVSTVLFVVVTLVGLVDLLGTLTSPGVTLVGLLTTVLLYAIPLVVLGLVGLACLAWGLYRVATGAVETDSRLLKNDRTAELAAWLERENDYARRMNLSEKLRPSERELERLIAEGDLDQTQADRERERIHDEY